MTEIEILAPKEYRIGKRVTVVTESVRATESTPPAPDVAISPRAFVLVHGLGMNGVYWKKLAECLVDYGSVYALDLPGFGNAPEPGPGDTLNIPASGEELAEVIKMIGIVNPVIIGHSMGTQLSIEAVVQHPDLTDALVLIAPTINAAERTLPRQLFRMVQDLPFMSPKIWGIGIWSYLRVGPRWLFGKLRTMLDHDVEAALLRVQPRTLVIRGEHDRVCPHDWCEQVTRLLPRGELHEVAGRGHETMIEQASPVAHLIIDFLQRVESDRHIVVEDDPS